MACLVAAKAHEPRINRWLGADPKCQTLPKAGKVSDTSQGGESVRHFGWQGVLLAVALALACRQAARMLPLGTVMASTIGWAVLLVTTCALALSCVPAVRRLGQAGASWGYPGLYLVLSALGAQASLSTLMTAPIWLGVGAGWLVIHAAALLIAGKIWRWPLGVLATASQANVGGVVSAPLVGAVYDQRLAAAGLVLAVAGNAVGTYLGLASAALARWLTTF
jgi:uncharacterized membrane protein